MQRLFSTFPGGRPGFGLLLLRISACVSLVMQANAWIGIGSGPAWQTIAVACAFLSAILLLVGVLSPIGAGLAAVCAVAAADPCLLAVLAAIALLGPGAMSVDARLFGRREIVID